MANKIDFTDLSKVLVMIQRAQDSERDQRQKVRDAKLFLNKRDGQWDPYAWQKLEGRLRMTFDMCTPIVDQISGEVDQSDFSLKVSPVSGEASEDTSKTYAGLIRNIRNISNADKVFADASRSNVIGGFDCVEVVQEYVSDDSFDQDLIIKKVPNAVDSVWFDDGAVEQDKSDSMWGVKLIAIPTAEYDERFPKGSKQSVSDDRQSEAYWHKAESIIIGQLYYKKSSNIELVLMSDGAVYEIDDKYESIKDELEQQGIAETKRRTKKVHRVFSRMFDGGEWLNEEQETVFDLIPLVPIYGNYDVFENKVIYFGKLEKLYDQQRGLNYALSRDIEDGALSPKKKYWGTPEQIEGYESSIETLNTNNEALQLYNHVDNTPPPFMQGGVDVSSGLQTTVGNMQQMLNTSANAFNAQQGNAQPLQSGIAGAQQIDQGNIGNIKWFKALECMICGVGKVILKAIPRVYDSTRQVRLLEDDGTGKMVTLNDVVFDQDTQQNIEVNDLSKGQYDIVCEYGPAFNSQQKETAQAFLEMSNVVPGVAEIGSDVWVKNVNTPGMEQIAERLREIQFNNGNIPESQWTDEERQKIAEQQALAAQQPPQEDPNMVLARAEERKAQAELTNAQTKQFETQTNQQLKAQELQLEQSKIELDVAKFQREKDDKFNVDAATIQQNQQKIDLQADKQASDQQAQQFKAMLDTMKQQQDSFSQAVNDLKVLREAIGVDSIVGPSNTNAYIQQSEIVTEKQEDQGAT